ncbi:MAG: hypothetical protein Q9170_005260 [Blastenia crenularia]
MEVDEALSGAMANLKEALDSKNEREWSPHYSTESTKDESHGLSSLPMPPSDLVLKLLKRTKGIAHIHHPVWFRLNLSSRPQRFLDDFPALDSTTMIGYCQKVFFATESYSIAAFIIMNTSLVWILRGLREQVKIEVQISPSGLARYSAMLLQNVDIALRKLPLVAASSKDNITALLLASSLAVESSIQASAWDLLSTATHMALSAGFHRLVKKPGDEEQRQKRVIFWLTCTMDRALALNLGGAPNIQDYDIQMDRMSIEDLNIPSGYPHVHWIDVSELQRQIYLQLYSAHAQKQSAEAKTGAAKQLATRCLEIRETLFMSETAMDPVPEPLWEMLRAQEIIFQSLLTMIYRFIPAAHSSHPLQFCDECIQSARTALTLHNKAWSMIAAPGNEDWRIFIHWSTLFSPFVPFISIFGNVIAQSNPEDLTLLGVFVSTLKFAAEQSTAIKKLYHGFHKIAKAYIANKSRPSLIPTNRIDKVSENCQPGYIPDAMDFQPLSDFSLSQQDWDLMLNDWDLGLGAEDARHMSSFLDLFPNT